jgi:hypothetical protein
MVMIYQVKVFHNQAREQSRPPRAFREHDYHLFMSSSVTVHHDLQGDQNHLIGYYRHLAPLATSYP